MIKPKQNCLVYHADGVCPGYPSPTTMKEKGKLVGVCNCQCHCDIQCFTDHDLTGCEHCQPSEEANYATRANTCKLHQCHNCSKVWLEPSEEKELIKR